jgi:hypothetical protein
MTTNNKDLSVHPEYATLSPNCGLNKPSSDLNCVLRYNRNTLFKPMPDVDAKCMTIRSSGRLSPEEQQIQDPKGLRKYMVSDICIADVARIVASIRSTSLISANVELRTMPLAMWNNAVAYVQVYVGIDLEACVVKSTATDTRSPAMTLGFVKGVLQMVGVAGYLAGVQPEMTARAGQSALVKPPRPLANMSAADQQRYDEMVAIASSVRDSAAKPTDQLVIRACDLVMYADAIENADGTRTPLPRLSDAQFTALQYAAFCYAGFSPKTMTVESCVTKVVDTHFAEPVVADAASKFNVEPLPVQKSVLTYSNPIMDASPTQSRAGSPPTYSTNYPAQMEEDMDD